jgi:hypothetical protein
VPPERSIFPTKAKGLLHINSGCFRRCRKIGKKSTKIVLIIQIKDTTGQLSKSSSIWSEGVHVDTCNKYKYLHENLQISDTCTCTRTCRQVPVGKQQVLANKEQVLGAISRVIITPPISNTENLRLVTQSLK